MGVNIGINDQIVLQQARDRYGDKNQIAVALEELCELGAVLSKFVRYDDPADALEKTRDKVLDEVADVYVVLEHVKNIYDLGDAMIEKRASEKVLRVERWLRSGKGFEQTTRDREVPEIPNTHTCSNCFVYYHPNEFERDKTYPAHLARCLECKDGSMFRQN